MHNWIVIVFGFSNTYNSSLTSIPFKVCGPLLVASFNTLSHPRMIMSISGMADSVVLILRNGFVNLPSKVETMKEWPWHLKVEIMDVMAASANICLFCTLWENYMGSPNYIVHRSLVPFFLAKLMLFLFSCNLLCFNYRCIGLGLGYMSNKAQWKTKINSQTCFDICNDLEVPLDDIVIVPYVN